VIFRCALKKEARKGQFEEAMEGIITFHRFFLKSARPATIGISMNSSLLTFFFPYSMI